jgi:transposase-like protein
MNIEVREMITEEIIYKCTNCGSENIVKNGTTIKGQQKYYCKDCHSYKTLNPIVKYTDERKKEILKAYEERACLRGVHRIFGVSVTSLLDWVKKRGQVSRVS